MPDAFEIISPGVNSSFQDLGRMGWKRFGVAPGGVMDARAAHWANKLLENPAEAPLIEALLHGLRMTALDEIWVCLTGAEVESTIPSHRPVKLRRGDEVRIFRVKSGVWSYLAVEGGFNAPTWFGSASACPAAGIGTFLKSGDCLSPREDHKQFNLPPGVAGRTLALEEIPALDTPPPLRMWPGPQWDLFEHAVQERFLATDWAVTNHSDRVGYRLTGAPLNIPKMDLASEPVRVGTIQIPPDGLPIVTMRDGPTVGGYPKIGLLHPEAVSVLSQSKPGTHVRFTSSPIILPAGQLENSGASLPDQKPG